MPRNRRILLIGLWTITALAALGLVTMAHVLQTRNASAAASADTVNLPALFDAPAFSLTDQDGKPFDSSQLRGKVWIADFIFTHCAGLCPVMTENLAEFQKQTPGSAVQMVSFSVDPERDTPEVLKHYGGEVKADFSRWHFLTGTRAQTWEISKGMKLAVGQDTGDQVLHSTHFLLVDGEGKVRGIYDSDTTGFMKKMIDDSGALAAAAR
jgi:protein SCO1/2